MAKKRPVFMMLFAVLGMIHMYGHTVRGIESGNLSESPAPSGAVHIRVPKDVYLGQAFTLHVDCAAEFKGMTVRWLGRELMILPRYDGNVYSVETLLGTDVKYNHSGSERLRIEIHFQTGTEIDDRVIHILAMDYPAQYLTVPSGMVHLSTVNQERVRRENRMINRALRTQSSHYFLALPLWKPVSGDISTPYGLRRFFNRQPRSPHRGVDFRSGTGDPVVACSAGQVILTGNHYFAGRSVYLDHGQGIISVYFHLSEVSVTSGQKIERGQVVGKVGSSGRVTGPHLHFGLYVLGLAVDPLPLLKTMED